MSRSACFTGCASEQIATSASWSEQWLGEGPALGLKDRLALFWLLTFDESCLTSVAREEQAILVTRTADAVVRLEGRRAAVLGLVGARFSAFYDTWVEYVRSQYPHFVLLRTQSLFDDFAREDAALRQVLSGLGRVDDGAPLDGASLESGNIYFQGVNAPASDESAVQAARGARGRLAGWSEADDTWPPPPTPAEIEWIDPFAQPDRSHATASELTAEVEKLLVAHVASSWSLAVPPAALHTLAARGEHRALRALAHRMPARDGALLLAWSAAFDPDVDSATEAACAAIRASDAPEVAALVPLDRPAVRDLATRRRQPIFEAIVEARLGAPDASPQPGLELTCPGLVAANAAAALYQQGADSQAEAALAAAFEGTDADRLVVARVVRTAAAFAGFPVHDTLSSLDGPTFASAGAFAVAVAAGRIGPEAVRTFVSRFDDPVARALVLAASAIGANTILDEQHQAELAAFDEARQAAEYEAGAISSQGVAAARLGRAYLGESTTAATLHTLIAEAHGSAAAFVADLTAALHPRRDDDAIASGVERVEALLAKAQTGRVKAAEGVVTLGRYTSSIVRADGAERLAPLIAAFETTWGPLATITMKESDARAGKLVMLLAAIPGRAQEAASVLHPRARSEARVALVAGLLRDGESEAAFMHLRRLEPSLLAADVLLGLVPAVLRDPAAASRIEHALGVELAKLPATAEAAAAWLAGS